jgi:signal transduction histidine kinase
MERLSYRIEDSTIAELLGVQNFTNEESALLELVKNAYDAEATEFLLDFEEDGLVISDNGVGMDENDIHTHWMYVGKSNKQYYADSSNTSDKRVLAGSKGVGRFALARLGKKVILYSKKENENEVEWTTDWHESQLETSPEKTEIKGHGTKIYIKELRDRWTNNRIKNLAHYFSITYNDDKMRIIIKPEQQADVEYIFKNPELGKTHVSEIELSYDNSNYSLRCQIKSDEFKPEAEKYFKDKNWNLVEKNINVYNLLAAGFESDEISDDEFKDMLKKLGPFSAKLFFSLKVNPKQDVDAFLYKYSSLPQRYDYGIVLYRNAFSIASFDGKKDWLELNKRMRKSPAAATHPTGSWRVRSNQMSGAIFIDKKDNPELKDMANRQGLEENEYFNLFTKIILLGITEFERSRQHLIRLVNQKNKVQDDQRNQKTPVIDEILKTKPRDINLNETKVVGLKNEIKALKNITEQASREKNEAETNYRYDVRILNSFVTIGLKAAAIAHEYKNHRNNIIENYNNIVNALKEYGLWEKLNSEDYTRFSYKNVPGLLKNAKKINLETCAFMNAMLEDLEKSKFQAQDLNIKEQLSQIQDSWEHNCSNLNISLNIDDDIDYIGPSDVLTTIFDNLILNTWQQNINSENVNITITVNKVRNTINFTYKDNGKGLVKKYIDNPEKILEVHETSRTNGHGLGMWIVNNTISMTGGKILLIDGKNGFFFEFTLGEDK